ncbi:UDP-3-O-(3-hydroxymyristoyl)glucosamine N-acyltransferase [Wenxinia saemankumensis]|uniref:UDP-3-O-[3-hydroxymyristoyl] glucosamine N-acyltransferase n=1 Tax=Wenxinia saemankumensis TaxID=1447782 RepID=A0A1M6HDA1_9RHOB|nr:UDP-3-O-(3-hydroxymyristoyl)glucosamine N-acyltransferase [Wenxinia saemankumensis]SHJ20106.1 UDP-3-O-[3-hydroxymyristoyl] glucosamine N-acyltransferase [Wenxinia saemankumensis]
MDPTIAEIAETLGTTFAGDGTLRVARAAEPAAAGPDDLAIALSGPFLADLAEGHARAALVPPGTDPEMHGLSAAIFAPRARLALSRLTGLLAPDDAFGVGLHPSAVIDDSAEIGDGCDIGPFCVIGAGVVLGAGSRLGAHVVLGQGVRIGPGARIRDGARIGPRVTAGARLVVQPGAVIGGDGFSFVTEGPSGPERARAAGGAGTLEPTDPPGWHKIESLGGVEIGDDVEIGANSAVDAGTIRATRIGSGTKIDNLVQVGHNAIVGRDCLLCGQSAIAGSTVIGNRVVLGGQTGVGDHLRIGDDVVAGGGSVILASVPAGRMVLGYPAQRMDRALALHRQALRAGRRAVTPAAENPVPKPGPAK